MLEFAAGKLWFATFEAVAANGVARFLDAPSEQTQWPTLAATVHLKIAVVYCISFSMAQIFKIC